MPQLSLDTLPPGEIRNALSKRGNEEFAVDTNSDDTDGDLHKMVFGRDDLIDVGSDRVFLRPGDLVELLFVPVQRHVDFY
jgi:hypothetical protein